MFKFFRKSTQSKNMANKNLKDFFKRGSDVALGIIQVIASTATCFTVVKIRRKENQLYKYSTISKSSQHGDDYEEKNKNPKDSSMDKGVLVERIAQIAQVAGAIATVVASVATWTTVREMRNERNQLYKPQMIFGSSHYSDDYEYDISGLFSVKSLICILYDEDNLPPLETTIYNIGSGAALEIKIEFLLENYDEYVEAIGHYFRDGTVVANNSGFAIHYDGKTLHHYANRGDCIIGKPFLLPGESMDIAFPKEFSKLLYYLIRCTWGDYGAYPTVHLQISFLDLQGIEYSIDYKLGVKMITSTSAKGDKYFHVDYNIEQLYLTDEKSEDPERYKEYYS